MHKLLTVAIPTFNRAEYLDLNLGQLCKQLDGLADDVELLVSDNCSSDDPEPVVQKYRAQGHEILYIRNVKNIGSDRNFIQCFDRASGQYLLVLGDDDLLVDGALQRIMSFLKQGQYGAVRLHAYGFDTDYDKVILRKDPQERQYSDFSEFIMSMSYYVTYVSGYVVNRQVLLAYPGFLSDRFDGTNFPHVYWLLTAAHQGLKNGSVRGYCVAAKRNNSGSYNPFEVFTSRINSVFDWFVNHEGHSRALYQKINNQLLMTYFPYYILQVRTGIIHATFATQDAFRHLRRTHGRNPRFWLINAPLFLLPRPLCRWVYRLGEAVLIRR
jgi:glycosyltransferase involved in cell wall biosynthesis